MTEYLPYSDTDIDNLVVTGTVFAVDDIGVWKCTSYSNIVTGEVVTKSELIEEISI